MRDVEKPFPKIDVRDGQNFGPISGIEIAVMEFNGEILR